MNVIQLAAVALLMVARTAFAQGLGGASDAVVQFVPLFLVGIPFAIGNWFLARRIGSNATAWVILTLIPIVNYIFAVYVAYQVVFYIIDRLKEIRASA